MDLLKPPGSNRASPDNMSKTTFDKTSVTLDAVRAGTLTVRDIDTEFIDAVPEDPLEHEEKQQTAPA